MRLHRARAGVLLGVLAVAPAMSRAESPQWFLAAGGGVTVHVGPTHSDVVLATLAPQWSRRVSRRFEYVAEGHVSYAFHPGGYVAGVLPLGARYLFGEGARRIYFGAGAGIGWTNLTELPEIDRGFNFLLHGGVGLRWGERPRQERFVELRLLHLSNADTAGHNAGVNALVLATGWRIR